MRPSEHEQRLLTRYDAAAAGWELGTEEPVGPAGAAHGVLADGIDAYVDLADPGALPRVVVDAEPPDLPVDPEHLAAVEHWLGPAVAARVAAGPSRQPHEIHVADQSFARLVRVARHAAMLHHAELDELRRGGPSPWWRLEELHELGGGPTLVRQAAEQFLASPVHATSAPGRRLLARCADLLAPNDAMLAASLRARSVPVGPVAAQNTTLADDLRLLEAWATATRARFEGSTATVVLDPLVAPLTLGATRTVLMRRSDTGQIDVTLATDLAAPEIWLRVYDHDRSFVALTPMTRAAAPSGASGGSTLRAELLLHPSHELDALRFDVTDAPDARPPTDGQRRAWIAATSGAWAAAAERALDMDRAAELWSSAATSWEAVADLERAAIAEHYAADALDAAGNAEAAAERRGQHRGQYLGWSWRRLLRPRRPIVAFVAEAELAIAERNP